jgi:hypothetical protein
MRFRKVRIVWSAVCGIAFVLLIVLWVRSFLSWDVYSTGMSLGRVSRLVQSRVG